MNNDVACREMFTRVCPRSLPNGCADECARFSHEKSPDGPVPISPELVAIWEEHFRITDEMTKQ